MCSGAPHLLYHWVGMEHAAGISTYADVRNSDVTSFPLIKKDLKQSIVISAYSQFMAASNGNLSQHPSGSTAADAAASKAVAYGLQGSITEVPAGYSLSFIISTPPKTGAGVNAAFESWGDKLLSTYVRE